MAMRHAGPAALAAWRSSTQARHLRRQSRLVDEHELRRVEIELAFADRNAIERMFCRIKDFRRIATRYDRLARNFLAAVCIAATVSYWL
ncbi:hypothetical protein X759_31160 [Mesorhizobium sp. LSHC420B00]|nr:hypothetical protein X759_31160 [Mesorhizobium sp. LSHC420B00]